MKIFISIDAEGIAGVSDWEQIRSSGDDYALGRSLLTRELNAVIDGVLMADESADILVNDSHGAMRNFDPVALHGGASSLTGRHKPMYMMEGLDASFDAALFIGYHGSMGARALLSHTYNPRAIWEVKINGEVVGESAINALVAAYYQVPIALISGDADTIEEFINWAPDVTPAQVKQSITRFAALSLHPEKACAILKEKTAQSLQRDLRALRVIPSFGPQITMEITFLTADMAAACAVIRGIELDKNHKRTAILTGDDYLAVFRSFVGVVQITRSLVE